MDLRMRISQSAHAVEMRRYGPPEVLTYTTASLSPLLAHEVRIRSLFCAVNHTDLRIRAGQWPIRRSSPFPYIPGVEVVGTISEVGRTVSNLRIGQSVFTTMQGLGGVRAERPGAYAEFVTADADAVALIPPGIDLLQIAVLGLVGVTAYHGLKPIGSLKGKLILVTGAAGGIGSAAVGIARAQGASVIALIARQEHVEYVTQLGAERVIVSPKGNPARLESESVDGVLDCVGGDQFGKCVGALRSEGVLSLVGAVAGDSVNLDAWQLIRPVTLTGYSTETLDGHSLRESVAAISDWIRSGAIQIPHHTLFALADACEAHRLLEQGRLKGRVLLTHPGADTGGFVPR